MLALAPPVSLKPIEQIAVEVVPPPGFEIAVDQTKHGAGIISKFVERHWHGPAGVTMVLLLDDSISIESYSVAAELGHAIEQTRELYPAEKVEAAHVFVVNRKEWILIRTRGDYHGTKYRRIALLTHHREIYLQMHFVGPYESLKEMVGYIEFEMRLLSGAKPDDPILPL